MGVTGVVRTYNNFKGIDFLNDASLVSVNRSPDSQNMYKNYKSTQGGCIETRPGLQKLKESDNLKINSMHFYNNKCVCHSATELWIWNNFPSTPINSTVLKQDMKNSVSVFFIFNNKLYINDGEHYLVYDGTLNNVSDVAYVPITSINRSPSGGGIIYEDVNLLTGKRKNSFCADGTSTDYYLDCENIDSIEKVTINGVEIPITDYTPNLSQGKISFTTAPSAPLQQGEDNVDVLFTDNITGYLNRIQKCTISLIFDNRVFFSGNPDYPNAFFHSSINNPAYISDLDYYQDGTNESKIKALVVGNNVLWVFKEPSQSSATIFYHVPTTDLEYGRIYPSKQGNVSIGCYVSAINYSDDIVFLSKRGLEGIASSNIDSEQLVTHRSSLIDSKLINSNNYNLSQMIEWEGYLLILVDGFIFLGDIRQIFNLNNGLEYEWYYWTFNKNITYIKEYKGNLYLGSNIGEIFKLTGTNDDEEPIYSNWRTPRDMFGYGNRLKTIPKKGGVAKIKIIPNGIIKVSEKTNKNDEKFINRFTINGFDFNNVNFENFTFTTENDSYIVYKIREKKINDLQLNFYTDELDKPFGIYSAIVEALIGGYIKK